MLGTGFPPDVLVVDGTTRECTGVIAELEKTMRKLPDGATVVALVADVPSRIDVRVWAERKGHAVPLDRANSGRFQLTIIKGGRRSQSGSTAEATPGH
jgi:TusA-related sulfurtransferase